MSSLSGAHSSDEIGRRPRGGLLHERDYGLFWLAEWVNSLDTSLIGVLLPLFALISLQVGPLVVGMLVAATWAPWVIVGLPAGALVDRLSPRPVLIAASVVSAAALTGMTAASWVGAASTPLLVFVAFAVGTAGVFSRTASVVYWPSLVAAGDLIEGNAKLQASQSAAAILGPSLGGLIVRAFGANTGLLLAAAGFAGSVPCLLGIRRGHEQTRADRQTGLLKEIAEGIRTVAGDTFLRVLSVNATIANLSMSAAEALVLVFLVRTVGVSAGTAALLLALWGVGGLIGSVLARRVTAALGTARTLLATSAFAVPVSLLVPLTTPDRGLVFFAIGAVIPMAGVTIYNTVGGAFLQDYCAPELLGRVTATTRFTMFGAVPVGALVGGWLGATLGPRDALWITTTVSLLPAVLLALSPISRVRDLPTRQPTPTHAAPGAKAG